MSNRPARMRHESILAANGEKVRSKKEPLTSQLDALFRKHLENEFVPPITSVARFSQLKAANAQEFCYIVQENFARSTRPRTDAPATSAGVQRPHPGPCVLCHENATSLQQGRQIPGKIVVKNSVYYALATPYPFMDRQFTLASAAHEPQSWFKGVSTTLGECDLPSDQREAKLARIVGDLAKLAKELPGHFVLFNSVGSQPSHAHMQCFCCPVGHPEFPLQLAARATQDQSHGIGKIIKEYPVPVLRVTSSWAVPAAVGLMKRWSAAIGNAASFNAIGTTEENKPVVYLIPRNRLFRCAPGGADAIESMEILGEVIVTKPEERALLAAGQITWETVDRNLRSVVDCRAIPEMEQVLQELIRLRDENVRLERAGS